MRAPLLAALVLCGCPYEPRAVDTRVELTPKTAEVTVTLRDLRTDTQDPLDQFQGYFQLATAKDLQKLGGAGWLGTPTRWEWLARDGGVDLEVVTTIPRATFEACARKQCKDPKEARCELFALRACDGGYAADLGQEFRPLAGEVTTWPAGTTHLALRVEHTAPKAQSPLEVLGQVQAAPAAAKSTRVWLEALDTAFRKGDAKKRAALEQDSDQRTDAFTGLRREALHRQVLHLLRAVLVKEGVSDLPTSPLEPGLPAREVKGAPVLKAPLPPDFTAGLKKAYLDAVAPLAGTQHVGPIDSAVRALCVAQSDTRDVRAVCQALLAKELPRKPR
ncbi:MAG: hypothetical protein K1X89_16575 [Myxococcaceae bacterium]|nr:hypothetical protein [Myxococcaceae bacterium]